MPITRKWTHAEIEAEMNSFDWSRVDRMTDEEIEAAALADPDTFLPSDEELAEAVRRRAERLWPAKKPAAE